MKPTYLLAALALLVPGSAFAQTAQWRVVNVTGDGTDKKALMMVDAGSVTREGETIRYVWSSSAFATVQTLGSGGTRYSEMRIRYRIDCGASTFAIRDIAALLDNNQVLETSMDGEPTAISPTSPAGSMAKAVCSGNFSALRPIQAASPDAEGRRHFGR